MVDQSSSLVAGRGERLADAVNLVSREIVKHHDVTRRERRRQGLLDVGAESDPGHWPVEHQRRQDAGLPEAGDQGRRAPVAVRHAATRRRSEGLRP
jgi:hypothetical protein